MFCLTKAKTKKDKKKQKETKIVFDGEKSVCLPTGRLPGAICQLPAARGGVAKNRAL